VFELAATSFWRTWHSVSSLRIGGEAPAAAPDFPRPGVLGYPAAILVRLETCSSHCASRDRGSLASRIRQIEYGIAENDIQNRFALSLDYALQYGKSFTGLKKLALAGWQVNSITAWQSGKPFTITETGSGDDNPVESDG
jgi:hypothetical protein